MNAKLGKWWDTISSELLAGADSLGVYVEESSLTLVHLQKNFSGTKVRHWAYLPRREGDCEALLPALQEAIGPWKLQACPVSLAVSRDQSFLREAVLPRAASENLAQVVTYELDRFLPISGERLYFDFQVTEETEAGIKLMLLAIPRDSVEACLQLMAQMGLRAISLEPAPLAAANAFALLGGKLPASWLLLSPESNGWGLAQVQGRNLRSCRLVTSAPRETPLSLLLAELSRQQEAAYSPQALCAYGGGLSHHDLLSLSQDSQLTLVTPTAFALPGLPLEKEMESKILPALGAALRGLGKVPMGANLLPEAEQVGVSFSGFSLTKVLLISLLALSVLWAGSALLHKRFILYQVDQELARLAPEAKQVELQLEASRALAKQLQNFRKRLDESPNKLVILKDLTQLIPDHTWLFQLRLTQQQLEMGGMSKSAGDLIPLLEKSGWLTKTEFASPIVTDASKLEHFKIKAEVKRVELGS